MKKLLALMMGLLLAAALAVPAVAANNFTKSPTVQPLPMKPGTLPQVVDDKGDPVTGNENKPIEVVPVTDGSDGKYKIKGDSKDGCNVTMWITSYGDKARLLNIDEATNPNMSVIAKDEVDAKDRIEAARADIDSFDSNFTKWKGIWKKDAPPEVLEKTKNRDVAVVSVFDVSIWCDTHTHAQLSNDEYHHIHNISLKLDENQLKNFVSLMHFNKGYVWEYVPSVVDEAASTISFSVDCENLSPFAIVAYSEGGSHHGGGGSETGEPTSPQTGEVSNIGYWLSCGTFLAAVGVTTLYRMKKEKRYAR